MNQIDLITIYLACGAPFGVYYFLQHRRRRESNLLPIKTLFVFVLWFPFGMRLLWNKFVSARSQSLIVKKEKSIFFIQKQIEAKMIEADSQISIYNFRETFERYVGLNSAIRAEIGKPTRAEKEVFRIAKNADVKLAAVCQHRRNRKRLFFHHNAARQDFLNIIVKILDSSSDKKKLGNLSVEFVKILNDVEAEKELKILFKKTSQTAKDFAVQIPEKDLWNPEIQTPLPVNSISTRL